MKPVIAIAAGGDSAEEEISLQSAKTVLENIDNNRYRAILVVMKKGVWQAHLANQTFNIDKNDFSFQLDENRIKFDYAFIAIHGTPGEDGKLQAYFDLLNIPYSSPNHIASTLTFNKWYCNTLLSQLEYNVAKSQYLRVGDTINLEAIIDKVGLPCFVKPCSSGSSYGISKVKKTEDLELAITKAFEFDHEIIIEENLPGKELTCGEFKKEGVITPMPITQIIPNGEFFTYEAKYLGDSLEITPARIEERIYQTIQQMSAEIYRKFDLRGIIRVDFMLVEETPYIIEVNAVPGLSAASLIPQQAAAMKLPLMDFFTAIIEETIK
ncbi:MAG: D-alanine--D-alanine ligase [Flavobacteriales bacterium]|nr:D-alanine--D-alanine ligase [Flavobacteriales bacterium]